MESWDEPRKEFCEMCGKEIEGESVYLDGMTLCQNCADRRNYG